MIEGYLRPIDILHAAIPVTLAAALPSGKRVLLILAMLTATMLGTSQGLMQSVVSTIWASVRCGVFFEDLATEPRGCDLSLLEEAV